MVMGDDSDSRMEMTLATVMLEEGMKCRSLEP